MFTEIEPPVTKKELETQFKAFAKGELATAMKQLHNQVKKDLQEEVKKILSSESAGKAAIVDALKQQAGADGGSRDAGKKQTVQLKRKAKKADDTNAEKAKAYLKTKKSVFFPSDKEKEASKTNSESGTKSEQSTGQRELQVVSSTAEQERAEAAMGHAQSQPLLSQQDNSDVKVLSSVESFVLSQTFEYATAAMVLLNVLLIGIETQIQASTMTQTASTTKITTALDGVFCILFATELCLRLYVYREAIWLDEYLRQSTIFDTLMVLLQIVDLAVVACSANVHALSLLRIVRVSRILRTMRLLHLFDELHALLSGMTNAISSMLWTCFLVALMMYMFSIALMQALMTAGDIHSHHDLDEWFGSVDRAVCTMFEILLGGIDWSIVMTSLMVNVHPIMGIVMSSYIVVSLFFLMNLVCGVFVERVTRTVREDKDALLAKRLSKVFTIIDEDGTETEVTWEDFAGKLKTDEAVRSFFASIDVNPDPNNAKGLFELIDVDGSGQVSADEIVAGCLRLRGPAKALEVALLNSELSQVSRQTAANGLAVDKVSTQITDVFALMQKINHSMNHEGEDEEGAD